MTSTTTAGATSAEAATADATSHMRTSAIAGARPGPPAVSQRDARRLPRRIYPYRILGMGLGGVAIASVLYQNHASLAVWGLLAFTALVWPHLAYLLASRSRTPYRVETLSLLIDSALAGAWVPLLHFNLLPSMLLVTLTTVDKISTGISGLWLRSIPGLLLGGIGAALIGGLHFDPATRMPVLLACLPLLLIHTISVSLGSYRLIRRISEQNQQLDRLRRTDSLTGLHGRAYWREQAEKALQRSAAGAMSTFALMIDIDRFKQVNDRHGHGAGDELMREIATAIAGNIRVEDAAGRLGGDEFAVLLRDTDASVAAHAAERIRDAVERLDLRHLPDVRPSISIGLAAARPEHATLQAWLNDADAALYRAKALGRNRIAVFSFSPD